MSDLSSAEPTTHHCFQTIFEALSRCDADGRRDETAWTEVHRRFSVRLIALARSRLFDRHLRQKMDADDIVQSIWRTFDRRHRLGQFEVASWEGLWALLMVLTIRRACKWVQKLGAAKGPLGKEVALDATNGRRGDDQPAAAFALADDNPTPEEVHLLVESVKERLAAMPAKKRKVVEMGLAGFRNAEIGSAVGRTEARVRQILDNLAQELLGLLVKETPPGAS
jgi:RNA polymerase sigma-70 factor (ECF subfamily)